MKRNIQGGLYLVVDPAMETGVLLSKMEQAIRGGVNTVQVWNNWNGTKNKTEVINSVCSVAHAYQVPVIINEDWQMLQDTAVDGVHFDALPSDLYFIRDAIGKPFICGITCGNNLGRVEWAIENNLDYISFCSLFPSASAGVCEIVTKETVMQARKMTSLPIFLAGGITLENIDLLADTGMNGIALISAIMKADNPEASAESFKQKLKNHF